MKKNIITISRQFGSGGRSIGKMLSERLGIPFYDKELIELASKESGIDERIFRSEGEETGRFYQVLGAIGFALGVVLGVLLSRRPRLSGVVLPILSIFNTIPGIVFIGLLFLAWGTHAATVLAALGIYATFPVLKNTYAGLVSVDPQYLEAARGCGMSPWQSLLRVELPLALPTIIGGLRMSTVYTVSWAVLASMIGLGGLGDFIYAGLSSNDNALILLGAIPAALLAFALGTLVDLLQRRTVPKGLRKGGSAT